MKQLPNANRLTKLKLMYWGEAFGGLAILLSLIRVATEYPPNHYRMFIEASRALWTGGQAYYVALAGNLFFFSPSCALLFYGPLSLLPEIPGLFIYTALSAAIFVWGVYRFSSHFIDRRGLQWFWLLMASQLYSGLAAHKPEVSNTGLMLLSAAWLIEGRRLGWAAFFLAMIGNFKLQPLPAVALIGLVVLLLRPSHWKWLVGLAGGLVFWFAVPWALRPWDHLKQQHQLWLSSLRDYSASTFDFYDNFFAFIGNNFGLKMSFDASRMVSMGFAAACAGALVFWCYRARDRKLAFEGGVFLALILGTTYTVLVSPLQQISAYVLLAPLFLALAYQRGKSPRAWTPFVWVLFFFWSIIYSELIPDPPRNILRHAVLRVPTTLAAFSAILWVAFSGLSKKAAANLPFFPQARSPGPR